MTKDLRQKPTDRSFSAEVKRHVGGNRAILHIAHRPATGTGCVK